MGMKGEHGNSRRRETQSIDMMPLLESSERTKKIGGRNLDVAQNEAAGVPRRFLVHVSIWVPVFEPRPLVC